MTSSVTSDNQTPQYPDGDWSYWDRTLTPAQRELLPQDKFDQARVDHLSTLPASEVVPLIPDILSWMQDMHWPIAFPVAELLLKTPKAVLPSIRVLLHTKLERRGDGTYDFDYDWQNYVLHHLVARMPRDVAAELRPDLLWYRARISEWADEEWGMKETVDSVLEGLGEKTEES